MKKLTVCQEIGQNIKTRRKEFNMTQEELASAIGVTRVSLVNMECGRNHTTFEKFVNLCSVLQCTPNDLFPTIPKSKATSSSIHISFKSKAARDRCLNDAGFVATMNKMITKAYYMKTKTKKK